MAASPTGGGQDNWGPSDDSGVVREAGNGEAPGDERGPEGHDSDYPRGSSLGPSVSKGEHHREKQVKPNKVYIGGLPEHTRMEDLQNCFGQIGRIINIELKVGYGFVEFDSRAAAEESVAKYHEGHFMGNKIRVELSHGGGRTAKYAGDPGACFKCGNMGHWARECPNSGGGRRDDRHDYTPRDSPQDSRHDYGGRDSRDYRRGPSPPRDYRDYPPRAREYDDYRRGPERDRYGAPPPPPDQYRSGRYPPDSRYGPPPPLPPQFDRYDKRGPRDDYDRPPPREFSEYRGRPASPPRYDYSRGPPDAGGSRYRRRSASPPARSSGGYDQGYPAGGGGYSNNGYSAAPPSRSRDYAPPPRNGGGDNYRRS
ncbi:hypothetical protein MIND_00449400 [Mycena indigotica]|uniref:RNA-binding domain-containing protein n=1 Tax=Mycena indigotica TaxID=2126181 RepID=A0A8H6SXP7_9AGAR|nr:uncharacterized protein MIND_00449400 [Mycena indigotica]KAF7306581.1 hypothetical protein MIND_00449400 [Mycena indigotica]